jgi:hypothetical protein
MAVPKDLGMILPKALEGLPQEVVRLVADYLKEPHPLAALVSELTFKRYSRCMAISGPFQRNGVSFPGMELHYDRKTGRPTSEACIHFGPLDGRWTADEWFQQMARMHKYL